MKKQTSRSLAPFVLILLTGILPLQTKGQNLLSDKSIQAKSEWVSLAPDGKLQYKKMPQGDRIMDFSYVGYMGGGVRIPTVPVRITISPVEGDNADVIQQAIDQVSQMKLVNGFRGTVLLKSGTYNCAKELQIKASGVVLRGEGSESNGTVLNMIGKAHTCVAVRSAASSTTIGEEKLMTDKYVPSGSTSFHLASVSKLAVGDTIRITRPLTDAWVHFMKMDSLVRDGKKQIWVNGDITLERVIKAISGTEITVDVPLTDSFDSKYLNPPGASVVKISTTGELSQIGIENLSIVSPNQSGTINEAQHRAFSIGRISDGWIRNIKVFNTVNSIGINGRRMTIDNVSIIHNLPTAGSAKPADFAAGGTQLLFNRCSVSGDNVFYFSTGAKVTGPIVLLNCIFKGKGWIQPHQRWSTGLLVDECQVPDGGIDFMNRGEYGSGHGWSIGWAVAWNSKAKSFLNQQPPGSANWVIGSKGEKARAPMPFNKEPMEPEGIYDSYGVFVSPASLYLTQLRERLGDAALNNIGYGTKDLSTILYE